MPKNRTARLLMLTTLLLAFLAAAPASAEPQVHTYFVDSDGDAADLNPGDGVCATTSSGICTLRAAIQEANLDAGASTITFASPMNISYPTLPAITQGGTLIDGSSQSGSGARSERSSVPAADRAPSEWRL